MSDESLPDIYPNAIGDEAYEDFTPAVDRYGDPGGNLWVYLHALGQMLKPVDDISKDGPNGEPGWSQVFDLARAKTEWLPWMGQLVGYHVPEQVAGESFAAYDAKQRERIVTRSAWKRGTVEMMKALIGDNLIDPNGIIIQERYGGDPWVIKVWVYTSNIKTNTTEIQKAAYAQKLAGLLMEFSTLPGPPYIYDVLRANNTSYATVVPKFFDYFDLINNANRP